MATLEADPADPLPPAGRGRRAAGYVFDIVCCDCEVVYAYGKGAGAGGVTHGFCPACYEAKHGEIRALGPRARA